MKILIVVAFAVLAINGLQEFFYGGRDRVLEQGLFVSAFYAIGSVFASAVFAYGAALYLAGL